MKRSKIMLLKVFEKYREKCENDEACSEEPTNEKSSLNDTSVSATPDASTSQSENRQPLDTISALCGALTKSNEFETHHEYLFQVPSEDEAAVPTPISIQSYARTPDTPIYSPITPIDRNTFLSFNNITIPESSEGSSPLRAMSPETLRLFNELSESRIIDFGDDDRPRTKRNDPDYIEDTDVNHTCSDNEAVLKTLPVLSNKSSRSQKRLIDDDDLMSNEIQNPLPANKHVPNIGIFVSRPLKRRYSENDLISKPATKPSRSASISDLLLPDPPQKPVSKSPKKRHVSNPSDLLLPDPPQNPVSKSPKKRHVSNPANWKRNINRMKRLRGESYTTVKGKSIDAASLKEPDCLSKPNHQCGTKIPEEARKCIYQSFRTLKTLDAQRHFIISHVSKKPKKRCTTNGPSRKVSTNHYSLTVSDTKFDVCRDFFLSTLNIKEGMVRGALKKINKEGVLSAEKRGKQAPPNKLSSLRLNLIKDHIFSFPAMESHYCRKNSENKYLDSGLNVQIMYSLYKKKCEELGTTPACIEKYRQVFRSYKLRFHVPKKDMCKKCVATKELGDDISNAQKASNVLHLQRRDQAYLRRDTDKEAAKADKSTLAFNFDLEAVLSTPKGASGPFFYVRKLAVYNLTFYEFRNQDVDCYTWDETEGKRGSVEIATCVYKYITSKQQGITHVRMMSDNCGGQQKNFNFSCMALHLVTNHPTIEIVDHVFFESGHSHMECDSIHSKIEQKCKNSAVYSPEGWIQVMRLARTNPHPFNVNVLTHDEFLDFNPNQVSFATECTKKQMKSKGKNKNKLDSYDSQHTEQEKINFQDAVWIQYRKGSPNSIFIKTNYNDNIFKELKLKQKKGKNTFIVPKTVYSNRIPISKIKKRDLLKLCQENQIPRYYHSFYENLPDSETVEDRLPEPDATEADEDI